MRVGQSRSMSAIETVTNVAIGYGIALAAQYAIFPIFNIYVPFRDHVAIALFFTVVSLVRGYFLRRLFNWWHLR